MHNRFGEYISGEEQKPVERHPQSGMLLNVIYILIILVASFAVAAVVRLIFGWIVPEAEITDGTDQSHNFFLVYPLHGIVFLAVEMVLRYFFSYLLGYRITYQYQQTVPAQEHFWQVLLAMIPFEILSCYMFFDSIPSWYLGGFLAALVGLFNVHDVYDVLQGIPDLYQLTVYFWWLEVLLEAGFCFLSYFLIRKGRRAGEEEAMKERQMLHEELEKDLPKNSKEN